MANLSVQKIYLETISSSLHKIIPYQNIILQILQKNNNIMLHKIYIKNNIMLHKVYKNMI